jgi:hypothetical protein
MREIEWELIYTHLHTHTQNMNICPHPPKTHTYTQTQNYMHMQATKIHKYKNYSNVMEQPWSTKQNETKSNYSNKSTNLMKMAN